MLKKGLLIHLPKELLDVCGQLNDLGGVAWLVGGCVRDLLVGIEPKDWDIEVYHLEPTALQACLDKIGHCLAVGKHFGVFKLSLDDLSIDVALPRKERKNGVGHKDFFTTFEPDLSYEKASSRRDFSINAMLLNPVTGELLDFYHGEKDMGNKMLRHVSSAFSEDPLRPLRAMQFAGRFQLTIAKETAALCRTLLSEADTLPMARIWQEWHKWAKSRYPSYGLRVLQDMSWNDLYPELNFQSQNLWIYEKLDLVALLAREKGFSCQERVVLVFAVLLGEVNSEYSQSQTARVFFKHIGAPKWLLSAVKPLVKSLGMNSLNKVTDVKVRHLAYQLEPMNIRVWDVLMQAHLLNGEELSNSHPVLMWQKRAVALNILENKEAVIVTGKHLIAWGVLPSKAMGGLLKDCYQAQMNGLFSDEKTALDWCCRMRIANVGNLE